MSVESRHPWRRFGRRELAALLRRREVRVLGGIAGVALLVLALAMVVARRETLDEAWRALRTPDPQLVLGLVMFVGLNLVLTSGVFWGLIRRFGRVGFGEMTALIAASTLLNFVPMRPGLFGRIAWHRVVNGIPAVTAVRTIGESIGLSAACMAALVAGILAGHAAAPGHVFEIALATMLLVPLVLALVPRLNALALPAAARAVDLATWGGRYMLAFRLIDAPVPPETALALAAASTAASLIPLAGNGLGLREWTTGLLAPVLAGVDLEQALTAELVNRAAEIVLVVPAGLASIGYLAAARREKGRGNREKVEP